MVKCEICRKRNASSFSGGFRTCSICFFRRKIENAKHSSRKNKNIQKIQKRIEKKEKGGENT